MKSLVSGATGFLGRELVKVLAAAHDHVVIVGVAVDHRLRQVRQQDLVHDVDHTVGLINIRDGHATRVAAFVEDIDVVALDLSRQRVARNGVEMVEPV